MTSLVLSKATTACILFSLVEREDADVEAFKMDPAEKARHRQTLIQTKKREAFDNWFACTQRSK